ncbi:MAG: DUF167 domain-containing protein [Candidatus Lokiarchaeota archaeon]|nr:DUF167 domain-containing protein [Candidatus Lokiarchaeota archaeon]
MKVKSKLKYIKKNGESIYIINILVKPNSSKQKLEIDGEFLVVYLKSPPENNKANKELIQLLRKKLKVSSEQIRFSSGMKSKQKRIKIHFKESINQEEINNFLLS